MTRTSTQERRTRRAALAVAALPLAACGALPPRRVAAPDALALVPARTLALAPADVPGFHLTEELTPALGTVGLEDAFGRLGAYSATYAPTPGGTGGRDDITSSVNTYAGTAHARAAFEAWRAAVPRQYRASAPPADFKDEDVAVYLRDGAALIGFRVRNVLGSVCAPEARAESLARTMISR
ncbi:MAG TPA: hypothetical protein VFX49_20595, partial [Chloroflexota bacterium]|nr:hypothetical protein [Chloroflexota bacterium]